MKTITIVPTQDGHWLARCKLTGVVASGKTKSHAISVLNEQTASQVAA